MRRRLLRATLACFVAFAQLSAVRAQTTPFLSDEEIRMLSNEISGDRSFEHIRWLSHWHRIRQELLQGAEYVRHAAKEPDRRRCSS